MKTWSFNCFWIQQFLSFNFFFPVFLRIIFFRRPLPKGTVIPPCRTKRERSCIIVWPPISAIEFLYANWFTRYQESWFPWWLACFSRIKSFILESFLDFLHIFACIFIIKYIYYSPWFHQIHHTNSIFLLKVKHWFRWMRSYVVKKAPKTSIYHQGFGSQSTKRVTKSS